MATYSKSAATIARRVKANAAAGRRARPSGRVAGRQGAGAAPYKPYVHKPNYLQAGMEEARTKSRARGPSRSVGAGVKAAAGGFLGGLTKGIGMTIAANKSAAKTSRKRRSTR